MFSVNAFLNFNQYTVAIVVRQAWKCDSTSVLNSYFSTVRTNMEKGTGAGGTN